MIEDSLRTLNQRIKELEDQVARLKQQPAPLTAVSPATAEHCDPMDQRLTALEEGLSLLKGIEYGGPIYPAYAYNFNEPDSRQNLRIFDTRHNGSNLDMFQLQIPKQSDEGIGFANVLDFGKKVPGLASYRAGNGELSNGTETDNFEVQEAYLTYDIARSFMFGLATPFTHTVLLFLHQLTDQVGLMAGIVNGSDTVVDNNNRKSFLGNLALDQFDGFDLLLNGSWPGRDRQSLGYTGPV